MATVTVRKLDDDVLATLKLQAKRNHRSLEGEIRYILSENALRSKRLEKFRKETQKLLEITAEIPQTDSVILLREDRDR